MSDVKALSAPVPPGGTIGILGGGQLGRMLSLAAARLGLKTHIYSDESDAPAFQVSDTHTCAAFDDRAAMKKFAGSCDTVTFEWENVPAEAIEAIAGAKPVFPNAATLAVTQDRLTEKTFLDSLGLQTAPFSGVASPSEGLDAFDQSGETRAILKTRRFGYDGKGQRKIGSGTELLEALESFKSAPCILEDFIDFAFEASVIAARGQEGAFAAYDPPQNEHGDHILRRSRVPSELTAPQVEEAKVIAKKIADALDYVGVLCVELFVNKSGELLVNEIAPRVHNSGHWTLEACATSQFEQHIRAVAGWPLGDPARHSDAIMENIIGEEARDWQALIARGGSLHLYGKSEIRPGRKMGHITWLKK
ncbi:MAG TPA: 5-(carboxyamino)imidazole ribonucleotide synthase [Rhizomicrobium sp.]|jgi:5-(carboxyamino)imidazole ribonucleotide synthase